MIIRPVKINDDFRKIAELVYDTDEFLFPFLFGKREQGIDRIKGLILLENNSFSFKHMLCAEDDNITGILIGYEPKKIIRALESKDYEKVFTLPQLLVLALKSLFLDLVLSTRNIDGWYIQNISVIPEGRGTGIGTRLMEHFFALIKDKGAMKATLDVSRKNAGAKKLYERKGFRVEKKGIKGMLNTGVYRMSRLL